VNRDTWERDVVIVGGGVAGAAIARELSGHDLRCTLLEANIDVGAGTSKANTALLHTGFDAKPGSLESRLVRRGHELLAAHAGDAGIPVERTGALLVAWTPEQRDALPGIVERSGANGYDAIREIDAAELYRREPNLGPGALGALEVPDEGLLCPFTCTLSFMTDAVLAGCELRRSARVTAVDRLSGGGFRVHSTAGRLTTRTVVNAAGLYSDEVDRMLDFDRFTITPRKGELLVYDKLARPLVSHIVLAVPTGTSKGVLVSPTVYGNVMVGPTAIDVERKDDTESTPEGIAYLRGEAARIMPALAAFDLTAIYVGLRAASEHGDYQLHIADGYACVGGIRSTGVSSAMAIAEHVRDGLAAGGLPLRARDPRPPARMPNLGEAFARPYREAQRIAENPDYGRVVCFCERVTRGELLDTAASPVPPADLDGMRRRTRALMGRCQGFFCAAQVAALLAESSGRPVDEVHGRRS